MPDLDLLAAASAATADDEPQSGPPSGSPTCHNCGAALAGPYCGACGQRDQPLRIPLHRFLAQSAVEFFGIDGRVWRTLFALVFKPGTLTLDYLAGRRQRYLRPLRIYLTTTLLFFFLLQLLDPAGQIEAFAGGVDRGLLDSTVTAQVYLAHLDARLEEEADEVADYAAQADSLRAVADSLATAAADSTLPAAEAAIEDVAESLEDVLDDLDRADGSLDDRRLAWQRDQVAAFPPDSLIVPRDVDYASLLVFGDGSNIEVSAPDWLRDARPFAELQNARTPQEQARAGADLARGSIGKVPVVLFLLLPVFAFYLKVLYVRRGWYYSEHLVLGLHTHAFTFMVFTVIAVLLGAPWATGNSLVSAVSTALVAVGLPLYYLITLKRVYRQGWIKTILKTSALIVAYSVTLAAGGTVLAIILAALSA